MSAPRDDKSGSAKRTRSGEPVRQGSDGVWRKRVRLGTGATNNKHVIKLNQCTTEPQATKRGDLLAMLATRMTLANTDETPALIGLRTVGADRVDLTDKAALQSVNKLIGGWRPTNETGCATFGAVFSQWQSGKLEAEYPDDGIKTRGTKTVYRTHRNYERYIKPILEDVPVDLITREVHLTACKKAVAKIPESGSRRQALQLVQTLLKYCVHPLNLIAATPVPQGWLPSAKCTTRLQWLKPHEEKLLMRCTAIPVWRRVLWGWYSRNGTREVEALIMTLAHFDLGRDPSATLYEHENKTKALRVWSLNITGTAEGLRRWVRLARTGAAFSDRMFVDGDGQPINVESIDLPALLRADLQLAGVTRPELFTTVRDDKGKLVSRNIVVHDLRATCVTVRLAIGWSPDDVMRITGHVDETEMKGYKRTAKTLADLRGGDFVPLHLAIPELRTAAEAAQIAAEDAAEAAAEAAIDNPLAMPRLTSTADLEAPRGTLPLPVDVGHALATTTNNPQRSRELPYYIVEYPHPFQCVDMIQNPMDSSPDTAAQPRPAAMRGHEMADADAVKLASLEAEVAALRDLVTRQPAALVAGLAEGLAAQVTAAVVTALQSQGVVQRPRPHAVEKLAAPATPRRTRR